HHECRVSRGFLRYHREFSSQFPFVPGSSIASYTVGDNHPGLPARRISGAGSAAWIPFHPPAYAFFRPDALYDFFGALGGRCPYRDSGLYPRALLENLEFLDPITLDSLERRPRIRRMDTGLPFRGGAMARRPL